MKTTNNIDTILTAYIACALWSSTDENGTPLDDNYRKDDIAPESIASAREDIARFLAYCSELGLDLSALDDEQIGHDFWLTRNRHGAGFWDRGLGDLGRKLTDAAHTYGSSDAYVGDDGLVYLT